MSQVSKISLPLLGILLASVLSVWAASSDSSKSDSAEVSVISDKAWAPAHSLAPGESGPILYYLNQNLQKRDSSSRYRQASLLPSPLDMLNGKRSTSGMDLDMIYGLNTMGKRSPSGMELDMISGLNTVGKRWAAAAPRQEWALPGQMEFVNLRPFFYRQYSSPRVSDLRWSPLDSLSDAPIGPRDSSA